MANWCAIPASRPEAAETVEYFCQNKTITTGQGKTGMSIIVTDTGFARDTWSVPYVAFPDLRLDGNEGNLTVDLTPTSDPASLRELLDRISMIRVSFPSFSDGRGFSIARSLRSMGYTGRLRALGHVLADQYAMARRAGFDEIEISDDLAARQTEDQWLARADWRAHDYQSRLRA